MSLNFAHSFIIECYRCLNVINYNPPLVSPKNLAILYGHGFHLFFFCINMLKSSLIAVFSWSKAHRIRSASIDQKSLRSSSTTAIRQYAVKDV